MELLELLSNKTANFSDDDINFLCSYLLGLLQDPAADRRCSKCLTVLANVNLSQALLQSLTSHITQMTKPSIAKMILRLVMNSPTTLETKNIVASRFEYLMGLQEFYELISGTDPVMLKAFLRKNIQNINTYQTDI